MWGPNQTSSGPPIPPIEGGSKRGGEFRVVERVAYAHPVRDHHVYYAPKGGSQYEQRPPPPLPPPHNNQVQQQQQSVGYPFYGGSNSNAGGGGHSHQRQQQEQNSGRARVRRGEHNSECVLYDPSESVVVSVVNFVCFDGKYILPISFSIILSSGLAARSDAILKARSHTNVCQYTKNILYNIYFFRSTMSMELQLRVLHVSDLEDNPNSLQLCPLQNQLNHVFINNTEPIQLRWPIPQNWVPVQKSPWVHPIILTIYIKHLVNSINIITFIKCIVTNTIVTEFTIITKLFICQEDM